MNTAVRYLWAMVVAALIAGGGLLVVRQCDLLFEPQVLRVEFYNAHGQLIDTRTDCTDRPALDWPAGSTHARYSRVSLRSLRPKP